MCDKAVDTCPTTFKYVPDRFKTQEMCGKAADKYFVFDSVLDECRLKTQMCDKIVFDDHFKLKYCHYRYKIQKRCDKA